MSDARDKAWNALAKLDACCRKALIDRDTEAMQRLAAIETEVLSQPKRDVFDEGTVTHMARQARTIRRLRALADGYRVKADRWRKAYQNLNALMPNLDAKAEAEERARIVAVLRVFASLSANEVRLTAERLADAIERGEL